jgi:hypothetical protein
MTEFEQGESYLLQGILFRHTRGKTGEHHEKHVMTPGNAVKIRTRYYPNTSVPVWYQTILFRSLSDLVVALPTSLDKPATSHSTLRSADNR